MSVNRVDIQIIINMKTNNITKEEIKKELSTMVELGLVTVDKKGRYNLTKVGELFKQTVVLPGLGLDGFYNNN